MASAPPAAGWYDDPEHPGRSRWWDGVAWTEFVSQTPPDPPSGAQHLQRSTTGPRYEPIRSSGFWQSLIDRYYVYNPNRPWWKKKRFLLPVGLVALFVVASLSGPGQVIVNEPASVAATFDSVVPLAEPAGSTEGARSNAVTWSTAAPTTATTVTTTTEPSTTVTPTTVTPTIVTPKTKPPTTAAPTIVTPKTKAPTTAAPTTAAPSTAAPPTTQTPTTETPPTTPATTTPAPPTTDAPTTTQAATTAPTTTAAPTTTEAPTTTPVYFKNCNAARRAGAAPMNRGEPGYRTGLDRDGDGIACEH